MTGTRQRSLLEQQITALGRLVEQFKDDFALPKSEADLLVSCYEEMRRRSSGNSSVEEYAQQCYSYYSAEQVVGFFNDDDAGKRIFAEVAKCYSQIAQVKA